MAVPIGVAGALHILLFGILLPVAAVRSVAALRAHGWPPRGALYRSIVLQQAFFLGASLVVARLEEVPLALRPGQARQLGFGVVGALMLVAALWPVWRRSVARGDERILQAAPRTRGEMVGWSFVSVAAGIAEEIAYRGVLFALLLRVTGSVVAAAVLASVAFGVGHSVQGRGGIAAVSAIALVLHGVTWITGSLATAMVAHVLYDLCAGAGLRVLVGRTGVPGVAAELADDAG
jgi:membrane protease YdiL (CAAX protease family)